MKMKNFIYSCLAVAFACSLNACDDYLDINVNQDNVSNTVPTPDLRLRAIQSQFVDAYESAGTRGSWYSWSITKTYGGSSNDAIVKWNPRQGSSTWPYQVWFIYCGCNIPDLIDKAAKEEAWHYVGAAKVIYAWGFMTMLDLYGEMPFTDALGNDITPKFDDGKTIYEGCMKALDEALEYFDREQPGTATAFSSGDIWNNGNVDKWKKLAYGLKARWMLNTSKKKSFNPDDVLALLNKAASSNADNTIMNYVDDKDELKSGLRSLQHQNIGGSLTSRTSKFYLDMLANTFEGGSGVEDPRIDLLVPSAQFHVLEPKSNYREGAVGDTMVLAWRRTKGVDLTSDIRRNSGPVTFDIWNSASKGNVNMQGQPLSEPTNIWYSYTKINERKGDSVYIPLYSDPKSWIAPNNYNTDITDNRYLSVRYNGIHDEYQKNHSQVISTGTFYTRPDAPGYLLCYPEVCFMKAEVYFRKGDKGNALNEYKKGIRAHMELMNEKLATYDQTILGKQMIPQDAIDEFLSSKAVAQTGNELKMSQIMMQKYISNPYSLQTWNDMRRFNYSAGNIKDYGVVYIGYARPGEFDATSKEHFTTDNPQDVRYWPRRFELPYLETDYNSENAIASNPEAREKTIVSYPVWWDTED